MKRLLIASLAAAASLAVVPTAHADPGGGAFHAPCTFRPGTTGGVIVITPHFNILVNCSYPGPAEGGGADVTTYEGCVITPAGNFQCNPGAPGK